MQGKVNQKGKRAQAGLEYLMTYGWALILVATLICVLVFIVSTPTNQITFTSSDQAKLMLKGGGISGTTASIRLQNVTGGRIEITEATPEEAYSNCTLNNTVIPLDTNPNIPVSTGGEISIECGFDETKEARSITIEYTDYAGLKRAAAINASGGTQTSTAPECTVDGDCSTGEKCCSGNCTTPICQTVLQCDDGDACTTDACSNPGTCNASCTHTAITCPGSEICCSGSCTTPACFFGTGCSDGIACTSDICNNPGTCNASCSNPAITGCIGGDGCCPAGCNSGNDSDCSSSAELRAYYKFDEGSGTTANDSSGNGKTGTLDCDAVGSCSIPTWVLSGCPSGSCLNFDGLDSFVNIPQTNDNLTFTIEAWVKSDSFSTNTAIVGKQDHWYVLQLSKLSGKARILNSNWVAIQGATNLSTGTWYHVAGVRFADGTTVIYINGKQDVSASLGDANNPDSMFIGSQDAGWSGEFDGLIDEVKIYNGPLSAAEICTSCNAHAAAVGVTCNC